MPYSETTNGTLLGTRIIERLTQLGVSRRQFCIANNISRQTLYEIEHQGKTNLMPHSLMAIDTGCHWEPGTAARYASGESISVEQPADRVDEYIRRILDQISRMTVDELERESIWLEDELFGRNSEDMNDSINMIRESLRRMIPKLPQKAEPSNANRGRKR